MTQEDPEFHTYPAWYHEAQVQSLSTQMTGDLRQREALVAWIADIDARTERYSAQIAEHMKALSEFRVGTTVHHAVTGLEGTVTATKAKLLNQDGPWAFVEYVDGFEAWTFTENLVIQ